MGIPRLSQAETVTYIVSPSPTAVVSTPVSTPDPLPVLFTIVAQPVPTRTPFPDERDIVDAVLGKGTNEHWMSYLVMGLDNHYPGP
jgi:hypothetical protein